MFFEYCVNIIQDKRNYLLRTINLRFEGQKLIERNLEGVYLTRKFARKPYLIALAIDNGEVLKRI